MAGRDDPVKQLKSLLALEKPPPILLVLCPDKLRRGRITRSLLSKFHEQSAVVKRDLTQITSQNLGTLADEINSLSLFSPKQTFVLSNIECSKAATIDGLLRLFKSLDQANANIIIEGTKLPSNSRILKFFDQYRKALKDLPNSISSLVVSLSPPNGEELKKWIVRELRQIGVSSYPAELIVCIINSATTLCEADSDLIIDYVFQEIEKVALYANEGIVTKDDIDELFLAKYETNEFKLLEVSLADSSRSIAERHVMLSHLLRAGKVPFLLLALFGSSLGNYLAIKYKLETGQSELRIRDELKLNHWRFSRMLAPAKALKRSRLQSAMRRLLKCDSLLKNHSLSDENVMGDLISNL